MYLHDLQIKYLQFHSHVELNPVEYGINHNDFDNHANVRCSLKAASLPKIPTHLSLKIHHKPYKFHTVLGKSFGDVLGKIFSG